VEDDNQWLKRLKEGRFDAAARDGGLINEVTSLAWATDGPYNYQKFSDPGIDKLTAELESEFDLKKRRLILRKAVSIIRERRPQVPGLYSEDEIFLVSERLEPDTEFPSRAWSWKLH
jgi:ABC-type transport system substrate-binding protein